jgi:predicted transglutaminase-like cysteine proteinase
MFKRLLLSFAVTMIAAPATVLAATAASPAMSLGPAVAPPMGFAEMCQRQPGECLEQDDVANPTKQAAMQVWAGQARWASVFGGRALETPASAFVSETRMAHRSWGPRWNNIFNIAPELAAPDASAQSDAAQGDTAAETPASTSGLEATLPQVESEDAPVLAELDERTIFKINSQVNRKIHRATDFEVYGRQDYWASSSDKVKRGDCEDYVLAKRRALIEAGAPSRALSIALVRTPYGEMHAVGELCA